MFEKKFRNNLITGQLQPFPIGLFISSIHRICKHFILSSEEEIIPGQLVHNHQCAINSWW